MGGRSLADMREVVPLMRNPEALAHTLYRGRPKVIGADQIRYDARVVEEFLVPAAEFCASEDYAEGAEFFDAAVRGYRLLVETFDERLVREGA